ncbi:MAG TPA: hypothetical protein VJL57_03090 [Candidatus Paceibacterota bacterium]
MDPNQERLLRETHRLAQENNRLLRKMRRQAWIGRIITLVFYVALIAAPIWFYFAYMSEKVDSVLRAYGVMQEKGAEAQGQYQSITEALKQFQERIMGGSATSSEQ